VPRLKVSAAITLLFLCAFVAETDRNRDNFIFFGRGGEHSSIAWEVTENLIIALLQAEMRSQLF
jgi:hypothetical protein